MRSKGAGQAAVAGGAADSPRGRGRTPSGRVRGPEPRRSPSGNGWSEKVRRASCQDAGRNSSRRPESGQRPSQVELFPNSGVRFTPSRGQAGVSHPPPGRAAKVGRRVRPEGRTGPGQAGQSPATHGELCHPGPPGQAGQDCEHGCGRSDFGNRTFPLPRRPPAQAEPWVRPGPSVRRGRPVVPGSVTVPGRVRVPVPPVWLLVGRTARPRRCPPGRRRPRAGDLAWAPLPVGRLLPVPVRRLVTAGRTAARPWPPLPLRKPGPPRIRRVRWWAVRRR